MNGPKTGTNCFRPDVEIAKMSWPRISIEEGDGIKKKHYMLLNLKRSEALNGRRTLMPVFFFVVLCGGRAALS